MTLRSSTLPLGIDLGTARIRIALTTVRAGEPRLVAVAARDHDGNPRAAIVDALAELQTAERRCTLGLGAPDAALHELDLPAMPFWERTRAARFQAAHLIRYPIADAALSLVPARTHGRWILGVARRSAIARAVATVAAAGLRTIAVDDIALAQRRALPDTRAIIDVGHAATHIATYTGNVPDVTTVPIGGDHLTSAIARALGIDAAAAERRKRHVGFGGAGESERDHLIAAIAETLGAQQSDRVVLSGNGSRIPGLRSALAATLGSTVVRAEFPPQISAALPADVVRTAAADWSVAFGLSLWSIAA